MNLKHYDHYDREGKPIASATQWASMFTDEYRRIALDFVGNYKISTVWLGFDHNFTDEGPPLIFETMVFPRGSWSEEEVWRYSTEQEAREGHARVLDDYTRRFAKKRYTLYPKWRIVRAALWFMSLFRKGFNYVSHSG